MYKKGEWVVVFGGIADIDKKIKNVSFTIAKVLEEGVDDLFVETISNSSFYTPERLFVAKKACRKIPVSDVDISTDRRKPLPGDLVYYYHKDYTGKVVEFASIALEVKYDPGRSTMVLVDHSGKPSWYSSDYILVLDVNNTNE